MLTFVKRINRRRIVNFDKILESLKISKMKLRVRSVVMESLSFYQQVKQMSKTKLFLSNHGAQFVNIIFMQPYTVVVELFHPRLFKPCYSLIASKASLEYYSVIEEWIHINLTECLPIRTSNQPYINCDVYIEEDKLVSYLQKIVL